MDDRDFMAITLYIASVLSYAADLLPGLYIRQQ